MKASEIRLGNKVYYVFSNWSREEHTFEIGDFEQIAINEYSIETYQPIPLTKEWLDRFGFENRGKDGWCLFGDDWDLSITTSGVYLCAGQFSERTMNVPCDYVHQLQNLYFSITGQELPEKQKGR